MEKSLLNVINVGKLSGITQLCWNIRKSILIRKHIGVMNGEKPLGRAQLLLVIKECIQERNPITAVNVRNISGIYPFLDIRKLIVEINPIGVRTGKDL